MVSERTTTGSLAGTFAAGRAVVPSNHRPPGRAARIVRIGEPRPAGIVPEPVCGPMLRSGRFVPA